MCNSVSLCCDHGSSNAVYLGIRYKKTELTGIEVTAGPGGRFLEFTRLGLQLFGGVLWLKK